MSLEHVNFKIVSLLTVGFGLASVLGYLTYRLRLSQILGYLIAGYIMGPYSPFFTIDVKTADQLAEIGVILMLFGVGLHFKWQDLVKVKNIATVGAIGQTSFAVAVATFLLYQAGWSIQSGIVFGLAVGIASTVVLVRELTDHKLIDVEEGHIAMGWLIFEDIIAVVALLTLPTLAASLHGGEVSFLDIAGSTAIILVKFIVLAVLLFTVVQRAAKFLLSAVIRTQSHELFTISILAVAFMIAAGSALIFDMSIALGAFLAGMVIGQTDVRHKVSTTMLPIRDFFSVIFFLAVGMIFDPSAISNKPGLFLSVLAIILCVKPLVAFLIVKAFKYPVRTALTIAVALAQIGEFSFILAEEAIRFQVLPEEGIDILVACSLASIAINPSLFRAVAKK
ncbi:MAG: cation:proton antiporter [Verrucomicrobia bacterium]|nr:cation:proton antiporter [Verrucomicrobiota bacterium]